MATSAVDMFETALDGLEVTSSLTTAEQLHTALEEAILEPAVGAPLDLDGLSLPESVVVHPTSDQLIAASTGVTAARLGIAEYGTVVIQSRPDGDEPISLYPERHVAVLRESDLVPDMASAIEWLADEFEAGRDSAVLATGRSATADMGAMVYGVHGPREVHVVLVTDQ